MASTEKIKKFIQTMKTRDMRVPVEQDFPVESIPRSIAELTQELIKENMPLEFWYDTAVSSFP